jgi:hypothetical protein
MNEDFLKYMMEQENAALLKGDLSMLLHKSPEGGTKTFGFGHKLTAEEERTGKINGKPIKYMTRDDAIALFRQDLQKATEKAKAKLASGSVKSKKYGVVKADWDTLTEKQKAMLVDFEFNVKNGINAFPAFTYGVINDNPDIMRQEYKRVVTDEKGKTRELGRNKAFYSMFLKPLDPILASDDPEAQFMASFETGLQKPSDDLFNNPLVQGGGLVSFEDPESQVFMDTLPAEPKRSLKPLQDLSPFSNKVTEVNVPAKMTGSPPITSFMGQQLSAPVVSGQSNYSTRSDDAIQEAIARAQAMSRKAPQEEPTNIWRDAEGNPIRDRFGGYIYSGKY